ncbi:MAG: GNAT family N-acetyltransferase [Proteobacteria bacterium]|nr:GNAT family N-acetyltransferase [Pseudomonadota bacterium]
MTPSIRPSIRDATPADVPALLDLVRETGTLDLHTPYTYWTLTHAGLVLVAERDGRLVGLLTALRACEPDRLFLWQVGLLAALRGTGLAQRLLNAFLAHARALGTRSVDLTIAPGNAASRAMMERFCARHGLSMVATGETFGPASEETLFVIGL